eukprot:g3363.t1
MSMSHGSAFTALWNSVRPHLLVDDGASASSEVGGGVSALEQQFAGFLWPVLGVMCVQFLRARMRGFGQVLGVMCCGPVEVALRLAAARRALGLLCLFLIIPAAVITGHDRTDERLGAGWYRVRVPVPEEPRVRLSAALWLPQTAAASAPRLLRAAAGKPPAGGGDNSDAREDGGVMPQQWLLFCCPNGASFGQVAPYVARIAANLGGRLAPGARAPLAVLGFDYRGVANSSGWPRGTADLVADGRAALQAVQRMQRAAGGGAAASDIHVHGWSLGGAVAAHLGGLATQEPGLTGAGGAIISDRSFSSIGAVATDMASAGKAFGAALGYMLGTAAAAVAQPLVSRVWGYRLHQPLLCAVAGFCGGVAPLVAPLLQAVGWDLVAHSAWARIRPAARGVAVYHARDGVIPYTAASLHAHMVRGGRPLGSAIELSLALDGQQAHMHTLDADAGEFNTFLVRVTDAARSARREGLRA